MEFIKENQYRLFSVFLSCAFFALLVYFFLLANKGKYTFQDMINNPINYILIVGIYFTYKEVNPLVKQIWTQTDVRDNIEIQTQIKLEIENIKMLKELGLKINEDKLSKHLKDIIQNKESLTTQSNQSKPPINSNI